ncbi:MAG: hypothetical protein WBP18_06450 [Paracoccaceae bacterium]|jgi:hypothetical protein
MPNLCRIATLIALSALPAAAEATGPLKLAELSARLYDAGIATGDPVIIATAARLRKEAGLPDEAAPGWQDMLSAAETLAADDADLLGVIGDIRAETSKGVASGPIYHLAALDAGAADTRPAMAFRGGEYAEAYVEAASGTDLNLTVLDAAGNVVCTDLNTSHIAYCGWTPATDGDFVLVIRNAGTVPADYALMTN